MQPMQPLHPRPPHHDRRTSALQQVFIDADGLRVLLLTSQFPFFFIGTILDVLDDYIQLDVETTHIDQLEQRNWYIHLDTINAFYIEREGAPPIPELNS